MNNVIRERKRSVCYVKPRVIYVELKCGKIEQIEIGSQCTTEDVQEVFRSICGASRRDIIKLMNHNRCVIPIHTDSLEPNSPREPYKLELISCCPQLYTIILSQGARKSLQDLDNRIRKLEKSMQRCVCADSKEGVVSQVKKLEERVSRIQKHLQNGTGEMICGYRLSRDKSETNTHCKQCCYYRNRVILVESVHMRDMVSINQSSSSPSQSPKLPITINNTNQNFPKWEPNFDWGKITKNHDQIHAVWNQYQSLRMNEPSWTLRESLKQPHFNMWLFTDAELLWLVRNMFISLGMCGGNNTIFSRISVTTLDLWLLAVYQHYNCVPFHNFTHAFCVVQMLYAVIYMTNLSSLIEDLDIIILMFAALSHDLDHPGLNNSFQVNAKTTIAKRYNDQSPLENHHCTMAFQLIEDEDKNIFKYLSEKQFKRVREMTIKCILGTDMLKHSDIVAQFKAVIPKFDLRNNIDHRNLLMVVIIKVCDISNEARPAQVSEPWVEYLLEEFFQQSDLEKSRGLPWAPFMDRDKATKSNSQVGFIKFVILPLFEVLGELFPTVQEKLVGQVKKQLQYYSELQDQKVGSIIKKPVTPEPSPNLIATGNIKVRRKFSLGSCQTPICGPPPTTSCFRKISTGATPVSLSSTTTQQTYYKKSSVGSLTRCSEQYNKDCLDPTPYVSIPTPYTVPSRKSSADCLTTSTRAQFFSDIACSAPSPSTLQLFAPQQSARASTSSLPSRKSSTGSMVAASG